MDDHYEYIVRYVDDVEFRKGATPFSEEYHHEMDESLLVGPKETTLYKSLLGSAN